MTNLKMFRTMWGLSQSQLSMQSGVSLGLIQHYEQGVKDINHAQANNLLKLATVLQCSIEDLLE